MKAFFLSITVQKRENTSENGHGI
ncbi:YrzI family small protein [Marivirga harenae]